MNIIEILRNDIDQVEGALELCEPEDAAAFQRIKTAILDAPSASAQQAEPVAEVLSRRAGNDTSTIDRALPAGTKLYAAPAPSASPASLTVAAQGLLSAWDSANTNEKYDECKFEAFSGSGAIQRLRESLAASPADQGEDARWIPVSERLPEAAGEYLVYRPNAHHKPAADPNICIREYAPGFNAKNDSWQGAHLVTHWMPLPSAPAIDAAMSASKEGA